MYVGNDTTKDERERWFTMRRSMLIVALITIVLATGGIVSAATPFTVFFDVMGLPTDPIPQSLAPKIDAEGIGGVDLTRGPGIVPAALTNGFSAQGWNMPNPSREGALEIGAYYQFGLVVQPGYTASLDSVSMSLRRTAVNAPMNLELQVSFDGFETPGITVATFNYYGRTSGSKLYPDPRTFDPYYHMHSDLPGHDNTVDSPGDPIKPIELSSIAELQNIPGGTTVTFRLYAWGNEKTTGTNTLALGRVDGPKILGTVKAE